MDLGTGPRLRVRGAVCRVRGAVCRVRGAVCRVRRLCRWCGLIGPGRALLGTGCALQGTGALCSARRLCCWCGWSARFMYTGRALLQTEHPLQGTGAHRSASGMYPNLTGFPNKVGVRHLLITICFNGSSPKKQQSGIVGLLCQQERRTHLVPISASFLCRARQGKGHSKIQSEITTK